MQLISTIFINQYCIYHTTKIGETIMEFGERRGGFGRRNFDRGPREMHKVTCSECGTETEVPFKPIEGRPVYCKDCYAKHKPKREY